MAADTANQKVMVPLTGVLKVQDYVRAIEQNIESKLQKAALPDNRSAESGDDLRILKARHEGFRLAIEALGLPIEVRHFR